MLNPFKYAGIVLENNFCNRKKEQEDIIKAIDNSDKLFIYSQRRMGKTSLIKQIINKLSKKDYLAIYIDVWPLVSESAFIKATAKAITESLNSNAQKMAQLAKRFFSQFAPTVSLDEEGKPSVSFGINKFKEEAKELENVLRIPEKYTEMKNKKVVIIFDEFQQVLEYGFDIIERKIRSILQTQNNMCYLFLGSRKTLIQKMFFDQSRPLYRSAGHYHLKTIGIQNWNVFIIKKFKKTNKEINNLNIEYLFEITGGHSYYMQLICNIIWDQCEKKVTKSIIDKSIEILIDREHYTYSVLWNTLSFNQKNFLKGIAKSDYLIKPFSSEFIFENNLKTASNVQKVINYLINKDIIDLENENYIITDIIFKLWINSRLF